MKIRHSASVPPSRRRWVAATLLLGVLLTSGWAVQAQVADRSAAIAARAQPPVLKCPDGSERICTPHGCYCG